jgi:hypothetical protein
MRRDSAEHFLQDSLSVHDEVPCGWSPQGTKKLVMHAVFAASSHNALFFKEILWGNLRDRPRLFLEYCYAACNINPASIYIRYAA